MFSVTKNIHTYSEDQSGIVYIGSTKNLKKRLAAYFNGFGHTDTIKRFIKKHPLKFCYCNTADFKAVEARLIHYFKENMGELPLLNKLKPRII